MNTFIRRINLRAKAGDTREWLRKEWLVTNGLGGYASGTIAGAVTWRYHGLLVAALPSPLGRVVMLNHLAESLLLPNGQSVGLDADSQGHESLVEFRLENQMPVWRFEVGEVVLEKSVVLLHGQNTVFVSYRLVEGHLPVQLNLRPSMHFRCHDQPVSVVADLEYHLSVEGDCYTLKGPKPFPPLHLSLLGEHCSFTYDGGSRRQILYQRDADRGYESRDTLWSPGCFSARLSAGSDRTLIVSTEPWNTMLALSSEEAIRYYQQRRARLVRNADAKARGSPAAELVMAADQFIINPAGRLQDIARAHAEGDELRTVIAGYHWFNDWGRDTMISLEGLTLVTGRFAEAGWILRAFAHHVRDGLIPNLFPEGGNEGLYHAADATLWFFHALDRYLACTNDREMLRQLLPVLVDIVDHHLRGTRFGIGVDPRDGLLRQGAEGFQLTWMDAKVEAWVVTPRRGKTVEINALWYNALRLLAEWLEAEQQVAPAQGYGEQAVLVQQSFNARFWSEQARFLFDVIDGERGDDLACRPNQLLAMSLKHPVLEERRWEPVLKAGQEQLLPPIGLRSLSPHHPDFKPKYFGDLRARDAAYHQGTVWAWLIGPFIDAWLRVHPEDRAGARKHLQGFVPHLNEGCIGSINEIFDAQSPFVPRGCIAQAWSVAEVLRAWVKTEPPNSPAQFESSATGNSLSASASLSTQESPSF
jgi:predicted glycogen debranching enzyme